MATRIDAPAVADEPGVHVAEGCAAHVLVVEDYAPLRALVSLHLESLGLRVRAARDGDTALASLADGAPCDLVLCDVVLTGGVDGVEVVERARALRPGLPVVLMSGSGGRSLPSAALHGVPLLSKPFTLGALTVVVLDALGRAARRTSSG
ncbi:MAG: response regulator [Phycisphaerales bacterium]|nr:MAG: response regulator [Phycisphaerales bacterium]